MFLQIGFGGPGPKEWMANLKLMKLEELFGSHLSELAFDNPVSKHREGVHNSTAACQQPGDLYCSPLGDTTGRREERRIEAL